MPTEFGHKSYSSIIHRQFAPSSSRHLVLPISLGSSTGNEDLKNSRRKLHFCTPYSKIRPRLKVASTDATRASARNVCNLSFANEVQQKCRDCTRISRNIRSTIQMTQGLDTGRVHIHNRSHHPLLRNDRMRAAAQQGDQPASISPTTQDQHQPNIELPMNSWKHAFLTAH
ncbi:hypothetical protein BDZ45DRAFT_735158 [Acephala macrosclerotiorum]|nr:hypothetical protein BDZ45DRAFT_735158 [Acephala macrosclerotiorum]